MKRLLQALSVGIAVLASDAFADSLIDSILATTPKKEAERNFALGDTRHIILPVCGKETGEVIPGWPIEYTPEIRGALEQGRRPITCKNLEEASESLSKPTACDDDLYLRLVEYAASYNARLRELTAGEGK